MIIDLLIIRCNLPAMNCIFCIVIVCGFVTFLCCFYFMQVYDVMMKRHFVLVSKLFILIVAE